MNIKEGTPPPSPPPPLKTNNKKTTLTKFLTRYYFGGVNLDKALGCQVFSEEAAYPCLNSEDSLVGSRLRRTE